MALLPPYIHLGVGRSNFYLESLSAGMSINNRQQVLRKTPIIPNSEIMVLVTDVKDP